jgi:nicotinate-nucleotide--dimethylbenzimidazole phosphoribosyltransferase
MNLLKQTLNEIKPVNEETKQTTKLKWDGLVKPLGSLGTLEELSIKIAGITGKENNKIDKKVIVVMASDNGVTEEGVSGCPQSFTTLLTDSMARGITGVATLAKFTNTDIVTVDIGLNSDYTHKNVINKKIAYGTKNFIKEPAMSYEEAIKSIETGISIGDKLFDEGYDILGTGELGIGNTTTSAAILAVFSDLDVDFICGKGAGMSEEQYAGKKKTIVEGISLHKPNKEDPIDVISKVGGFDIGGICGLFLSAAKNRKPVVMDGLISSIAALCAVKINPLVKEYIIPSHLSDEPGAKFILEALGLSPMLNMKMRLGEGSGCPLAFQIIEASLFTKENMGTFEEATIDGNLLLDIRES